MLPSTAEAWGDLSTSAPVMSSAGSTSNARSRPSSSLARIRLFIVTMLYSEESPRTLIFWPSPPVVRSIVMPGRCSRESATSSSGKRPSSVELIESSTTGASFLMSSDFSRFARMPVTTTSCKGGCSFCVVEVSVLALLAGAASSAWAVTMLASCQATKSIETLRAIIDRKRVFMVLVLLRPVRQLFFTAGPRVVAEDLPDVMDDEIARGQLHVPRAQRGGLGR